MLVQVFMAIMYLKIMQMQSSEKFLYSLKFFLTTLWCTFLWELSLEYPHNSVYGKYFR